MSIRISILFLEMKNHAFFPRCGNNQILKYIDEFTKSSSFNQTLHWWSKWWKFKFIQIKDHSTLQRNLMVFLHHWSFVFTVTECERCDTRASIHCLCNVTLTECVFSNAQTRCWFYTKRRITSMCNHNLQDGQRKISMNGNGHIKFTTL